MTTGVRLVSAFLPPILLIIVCTADGQEESRSQHQGKFPRRPPTFEEIIEERAHQLGKCEGEFKGKKLTDKKLAEVLANHKDWLAIYDREKKQLLTRAVSDEVMRDPRRANLCGSVLSGANLVDAHLDMANLSGANLISANLTGASLKGANLSTAILTSARLISADLQDADLSGAELFSAVLDGASLKNANLTGASLRLAFFRGASLVGTDLSGTDAGSIDLCNAIFEPRLLGLPSAEAMADSHNLSKVTFRDSPQGLVALRDAFKKAGMRQLEREVTYAIRHGERLRLLRFGEGISSKIESAFGLVLFELTTAWGMSPGRALRIFAALIALFPIPYAIALRTRSPDGIWRVWADTRIRADIGSDRPENLQATGWEVIRIGLYFSILSAFHIGWRDLNVGNWISRIQAREYTLRATGWVRTVSGIQSVISVYLLALWVVTYFGRPFG